MYEKNYYNEIEGNELMECTLLTNIISRKDPSIRLYLLVVILEYL